MSYDLNILCVNQKEAITKLPAKIQIYAEPQNQEYTKYPKYYKNYCTTMNAVNGIWYYLMNEADGFSSFELCDIRDVKDEYLEKLCPPWSGKEDAIDISVLCLREKYKQDVLDILEFFINQSPIKTVFFHSRYQTFEEEKEFIMGTICFKRFVELLDNNQILFNVCYVIKD